MLVFQRSYEMLLVQAMMINKMVVHVLLLTLFWWC
jgi:hypothetical protein